LAGLARLWRGDVLVLTGARVGRDCSRVTGIVSRVTGIAFRVTGMVFGVIGIAEIN